VIRTPLSYNNIIIWGPGFNALEVVLENLYLEMKYPLKDGEIETVHGDQMTTQMCYQGYVKTKQR
jgi:hypothetical protein